MAFGSGLEHWSEAGEATPTPRPWVRPIQLKPVRLVKTFFYGVLIIDAVIWAATGYPIYAWDAFLWIFGFWAIELNLAEWEQERVEELCAAADLT